MDDAAAAVVGWPVCLRALLNLLTSDELRDSFPACSLVAEPLTGADGVVDMELTLLVDVKVGKRFESGGGKCKSPPRPEMPVMLVCRSSKLSGGRNSEEALRSFWPAARNFGCDMLSRPLFNDWLNTCSADDEADDVVKWPSVYDASFC
jgi:hypothetical protein